MSAPDHLVAVLRAAAERHAERRAFLFLADGMERGQPLSYGQLHQRATGIAARLGDLGPPGTCALLLYPPGLEYIATLFGCMYAGWIAIPAYPPRPKRPLDRLHSLVNDSRARFALTTDAVHSRIGRHLADWPHLAELSWLIPSALSAGGSASTLAVEPGDIAILQYTSGSTNEPKGVRISHRNLMHNISLLLGHLRATPEDRMVAWLPPYHDMGLIGSIFAPIVAGADAVLMSPGAFLQRPFLWLHAISEHGGTVSGGPDFAYQVCCQRIDDKQRRELDLSHWKVAFTGAERVRAETLQRFTETFRSSGFSQRAFAPCYGLAEATLGVTFTPVDSPPTLASFEDSALSAGVAAPAKGAERERVLVACGPPLPGTELLILDPTTCVTLPPGRIGEIVVASESVANGYLGREQLSREVFGLAVPGQAKESRYLRTGDLGFIQGGELYVTGRAKDLIVILGANHYPEDIEPAVEGAHSRLRAGGSVAFGIDVDGAERLVIVAEVDQPRHLPAQEMATAIRQAVAQAHDIPVHEVVLVGPGAIPKTSSGKRQRALCRQLYVNDELQVLARGAQVPSSQSLPSTKLVLDVAQIMADVLEVSSIDVERDFFALGGHSLLATKLMSRLEATYSIDLPLSIVFENPTAVTLARTVASRARRAEQTQLRRVDRGDTLLLSFSQERMWFMHQLEPLGAAYNVAGGVLIEGDLVLEALSGSLQALIDRHEILRTRYLVDDGKPRAVVDAHLELPLEIHDVSEFSEPDREARRLGSSLASQPFNLEKGPIMRFGLFRVRQARHVLMACLHHIATDAWSLGIMLEEALSDYQAIRERGRLRTSEQPLQYVDYAAWQREWIDSERSQFELNYWRSKLANYPTLALPTDRPRRGVTSAGALLPLELSDSLMRGVRKSAQAYGATPFMFMLTAFQVLLWRYTGQRQCVIGVPIANRNHGASEGLLGTLVNTLALRLELDEAAPFGDTLRATRATCLEAYSHQNLPFERLVAALGIERQRDRSPLFQVMFDYQNAPMPGSRHGFKLTPVMLSRGASQFDLSLLVLDTPLGRRAAVEYKTDLFESKTVQRLLRHYIAILEAVVHDPQARIAGLPFLTAAEQQKLVELGTGKPGEAAPRGIVAHFSEHARRAPLKLAIQDADGQLSYGETLSLVRDRARQLASEGVGPGVRVALYLGRSRQMPVCLLALAWLGASFVPIDRGLPHERVRFMLDDANPMLLLSDDEHGQGLGVRLLDITDAPQRERAAACPQPHADLTVPAYLIYTSGSTGQPKGVEVQQRSLVNFLGSMSRFPGLQAKDHLLSVTALSFDISLLELLLPLTTGSSLTIASDDVARDPNRLAQLVEETEPTVMQATPTTWRMLLDAGWSGRADLSALCGGEPLLPTLARELLPRTKALYNMYGPTETSIWSTVQRVTDPEDITVGRPIEGTSVYILDRCQQLAPLGVLGEICIGGAGVARGYHRRPELTRARFLPDPFAPSGQRLYRTGDLGRLRPDGTLECHGRLDNQIKLRGHRIELGEIEAALERQPGVLEAVVVAHEVRPGDRRLVGYYRHSEGRAEKAELSDELRKILPEHMIPAILVAVSTFPLTANGKVDRNALPAPTDFTSHRPRRRAPPETPLEVLVARIWSDVLRVEQPSIHDSFFDVGHSLLAVQLFARIERESQVALPLATLFEGPTIHHLARQIEEHREREGVASNTFEYLVGVRKTGNKSPIFCVHGAGGNVLNLEGLARGLNADHPFYGLQSRGVDGISTPHETIEEMARAYLLEVYSVQPRGPYLLSGYCGGGVVAFEMARQLLDAGQKVGMLVLIDSYRPGVELMKLSSADRVEALRAGGPTYVVERGRARLARTLGQRIRNVRINYLLRRKRVIPHQLREHWLMRTFFQSAQKYTPPAIDAALTLLRARDVPTVLRCKDPDLGWRGLAKRGLEVVDIPGDHNSIAQEPNVEALAAAFDAKLPRA